MRIKSLLAVVITGLTLAVTGCGTEAVQAPESTPAPAPAADQVSKPVTEMAACKLMWTCNYTNYYSTQAACKAACGTTPCEHDYACTGGCICP